MVVSPARELFALEMYWTDPRLAGYPLKRGLPEAIWRPEIIACQRTRPRSTRSSRSLRNKEGGDASDGRLQLVVEFSFGKCPRGIQAVQNEESYGDDIASMVWAP